MSRYSKIILFITAVLSAVIITSIVIGLFSVWYVLRPWNNDIDYLPGEMVKTKSFDDVLLTGKRRYAVENTDKWVLIVHSYRSHKSAMSTYERHYHDNGFNTLCVDNRAHGQSEGKFIGMGYLDQFDIKSWVEYIVNENADAEIILHGLSMGGASCLIYSGREDVPENIIAVINDSGYVSAESYLKWKLKQTFRLPSFPIVPIANITSKVVAGYYMSDASALNGVKNSVIPTLFIHCDKDMTVPVEDAYLLYDAAKCQKDMLIIKNLGHGEGVLKNAEEYWDKVDTFINSIEQG